MRYRAAVEKKTGPAAAPKRIIFYRGSDIPSVNDILLTLLPNCCHYVDGVSEGQFKQVLELGM
jgi:hypothetical protein